MGDKMYSLQEVQEAIDSAIKKTIADIDAANERVKPVLGIMGIDPSKTNAAGMLKVIAISAGSSIKNSTVSYLQDWDHRQKEEALKNLKKDN